MNIKKANIITFKSIILGSIIIIIVLGALVLVLLPGLNLFPAASSNAGFPAKNFILPTTNNTLYNMSQDIGHHIIILDFMATWCGPCAIQAQNLAIVHQNFPNITIVSITISPADTAAVLGNWSHTSNFNWTFVPYNNQTIKMVNYYRVSEIGIPVTILIDKQGIVQINNLGSTSYNVIEQWIKMYY